MGTVPIYNSSKPDTMGAGSSTGGGAGGAARDTEVSPGVLDEIAKLEGEVVDRQKRLGALYLLAAMEARGAQKDVEKFIFRVLKDVQQKKSLTDLGEKHGATTELLLAKLNKRLTTDDEKMAFAKAMQAAADLYNIDLSGGPGLVRRVGGAVLSGLITVAVLMLVAAFALQISKMDLRPTSGAGYTTVDALRLFDAMFPNSGRDTSQDLVHYAEAMALGVLHRVFKIGSGALLSGGGAPSTGGRKHNRGHGPHLASSALQANPLVVFALDVAAAHKPMMGASAMDMSAMDGGGGASDYGTDDGDDTD